MATALEARDALKKLEGVVLVHPFKGRALVVMTGGKLLTEQAVAAALTGAEAELELTTLTARTRPDRPKTGG
jgi:hypothetical protein